jgi:hypothetical protein
LSAIPISTSPSPVEVPRRAAASPWILDRWHDLLLFVATPALLIPLVWLAGRFWTAQSLYAVALFGALGHHLPGMMRAYGDRELFARFRTRFIAAPLVLLVVCFASGVLDPSLSAIVLVTYLWGVWHGLMQTYGFLRIYDAKARSFGPATVFLDRWMCIAWFGAGVLFSTPALHHVLQEMSMAGGPALGGGFLSGLRWVWGGLTIVVTIAFAINLITTWRAGLRPSGVKLGLLATSIGFWWYSNVAVGNLLVGILLFELFHDVQYLSIVWVFNRKRVEGGSRVDGFTRFVFRQRAPLLLLYVALVAAYGALRFVPQMPTPILATIFTGFLAASTLLHFYFDSFIWKVKEGATRASLGVEGGPIEPAPRPRPRAPALALSAARWSVFAVPLVLLAVGLTRDRVSPSAKMLALGGEFPNYGLAQHNMAVALAGEGRVDEAIAAARRTLEIEHYDRDIVSDARDNLTWLLVAKATHDLGEGRAESARPLLLEAAAMRPDLQAALRDKGTQLARDGDPGGAQLALRAALLVDPTDTVARHQLQVLEHRAATAAARP